MNAADIPRLVIGGFFFLLGPVALVAYTVFALAGTDPATETATATVVRFVTYSGGNYSRSTCPVFAFEANGQAVEMESNDCDSDATLPVGAQPVVRYDPARPDNGPASHPEAPAVVGGTLLCSAIAAFMLWPKRSPTG